MSLLDFETDKLGYTETLESMRHIQRLEAIEMGFVVTAYGILIAGVLNARDSFFSSWGFWVLFILPTPLSGLLFRHFCARRDGYLERRTEFERLHKQLFGAWPGKGRKWFGYLTRLFMITFLALGALLVAAARRGLGCTGVPVLVSSMALTIWWWLLLCWEWHDRISRVRRNTGAAWQEVATRLGAHVGRVRRHGGA